MIPTMTIWTMPYGILAYISTVVFLLSSSVIAFSPGGRSLLDKYPGDGFGCGGSEKSCALVWSTSRAQSSESVHRDASSVHPHRATSHERTEKRSVAMLWRASSVKHQLRSISTAQRSTTRAQQPQNTANQSGLRPRLGQPSEPVSLAELPTATS